MTAPILRLDTHTRVLRFDDDPANEHGRVLFIPRDGRLVVRKRTALIRPEFFGFTEPLRFEPGTRPEVMFFAGRRMVADITASGMFLLTWIDVVDTTQLAVDLDLETHKTAIFTSTITPNFSSDTAYGVAPYNANEASGGSWSAGGVAVTGTAVSESPAGTLMWDATDVSQVTSTFTGGEGNLTYADALAGNNALCLHDFGTTASPNNGTMTITWAAGGILNIDMTP